MSRSDSLHVIGAQALEETLPVNASDRNVVTTSDT
jgi:hypothetical protein